MTGKAARKLPGITYNEKQGGQKDSGHRALLIMRGSAARKLPGTTYNERQGGQGASGHD